MSSVLRRHHCYQEVTPQRSEGSCSECHGSDLGTAAAPRGSSRVDRHADRGPLVHHRAGPVYPGKGQDAAFPSILRRAATAGMLRGATRQTACCEVRRDCRPPRSFPAAARPAERGELAATVKTNNNYREITAERSRLQSRLGRATESDNYFVRFISTTSRSTKILKAYKLFPTKIFNKISQRFIIIFAFMDYKTTRVNNRHCKN